MCYILFCLRRLRAFDGEIMRFVFNLQKYDIFFVWQKVFIKKFNLDVQFCACSVFGRSFCAVGGEKFPTFNHLDAACFVFA